MNFIELTNKYPEDIKKIAAMEKSAKRAEALLDIWDHVGIKYILDELAAKVEAVNINLLSRESISREDRDLLIRERDCWEWLINIFPNADKTLEKLNKIINEKL